MYPIGTWSPEDPAIFRIFSWAASAIDIRVPPYPHLGLRVPPPTNKPWHFTVRSGAPLRRGLGMTELVETSAEELWKTSRYKDSGGNIANPLVKKTWVSTPFCHFCSGSMFLGGAKMTKLCAHVMDLLFFVRECLLICVLPKLSGQGRMESKPN